MTAEVSADIRVNQRLEMAFFRVGEWYKNWKHEVPANAGNQVGLFPIEEDEGARLLNLRWSGPPCSDRVNKLRNTLKCVVTLKSIR
jgi:hypothetical protein